MLGSTGSGVLAMDAARAPEVDGSTPAGAESVATASLASADSDAVYAGNSRLRQARRLSKLPYDKTQPVCGEHKRLTPERPPWALRGRRISKNEANSDKGGEFNQELYDTR